MDNEKALLQRRPKQLVENCPISLDIERLIRLGILVPGFSTGQMIYWTNSVGAKIFSVRIEAHLVHPSLSWIELRFLVANPDGTRREVSQTIPSARTDPGFGEIRYWFGDEGRRIRTVYLPQGGQEFRSRHVHRLAYASQSFTRSERRRRRDAKIKSRLGADPNSLGVPPKPPRMRWKTYYRLIDHFVGTQPVLRWRKHFHFSLSNCASWVGIGAAAPKTIAPDPDRGQPASLAPGFFDVISAKILQNVQ